MKYILLLLLPMICFSKEKIKIDKRIEKTPNIARAIELCNLGPVDIHNLNEVKKMLSKLKEDEIACIESKTPQIKEEVSKKDGLPREKLQALEYLKNFDCSTLDNDLHKAICVILK